MRQQISKKIIIYLFIFISLCSINNFKNLNLDIYKISKINITGLSMKDNIKIYEKIKIFKGKNIFLLDDQEISKKINSNKLVQKFLVTKNYPSVLDVNLTKTNFLAITKINGVDYFIGANGNFIETNDKMVNIPFVFGNINGNQFLKFKKILDKSNFKFSKIDSLFYFKSNRWDIKTKDGLIIRLPPILNENILNQIDKISNYSKFRNIKTLDFRQKNQIIMRE